MHIGKMKSKKGPAVVPSAVEDIFELEARLREAQAQRTELNAILKKIAKSLSTNCSSFTALPLLVRELDAGVATLESELVVAEVQSLKLKEALASKSEAHSRLLATDTEISALLASIASLREQSEQMTLALAQKDSDIARIQAELALVKQAIVEVPVVDAAACRTEFAQINSAVESLRESYGQLSAQRDAAILGCHGVTVTAASVVPSNAVFFSHVQENAAKIARLREQLGQTQVRIVALRPPETATAVMSTVGSAAGSATVPAAGAS